MTAKRILEDAIQSRLAGEYLHQKVAMHPGDPEAKKEALRVLNLVKSIYVGADDLELSRRVLRHVGRG